VNHLEKYDLIICRVIKIDYREQLIELEIDDQYPPIERPRICVPFGKASVNDLGGYISRPKKSFSDDAMRAVPSGMTYLPQEGEFVLVAIKKFVDHNDLSYIIKIDKAIIIGTVSNAKGHRPRIFPYDKMWLDESGAKVHMNHIWGDTTRKEVDTETEQYKIPPPTGHMTILGNRRVELFGTKFLPFGLHSHTFDSIFEFEGKTDPRENIVIPPSWDYEDDPEKGKSKKWNEVFTYDILKIWSGDLIAYTPDFQSPKGLSTKDRFLEPPCPEPGEYMLMGDSGYQSYVNRLGQERRIRRNIIEMIGSSAFVLAYDPVDDFGHGMVMPTHDEVGGELKFWLAGVDNNIDPIFVSVMEMTGNNTVDAAGLMTLGIHGLSISCPRAGDTPYLPSTIVDKPDWVVDPIARTINFSVGLNKITISESDISIVTASGYHIKVDEAGDLLELKVGGTTLKVLDTGVEIT
jgi:hypothetical protein